MVLDNEGAKRLIIYEDGRSEESSEELLHDCIHTYRCMYEAAKNLGRSLLTSGYVCMPLIWLLAAGVTG